MKHGSRLCRLHVRQLVTSASSPLILALLLISAPIIFSLEIAAQAPYLGTWEVTVIHHSHIDKERWESRPTGGLRRTLLQTGNPAWQQSVGKEIRYYATFALRKGGWEYDWGVGAHWQKATCTFEKDSFSCTGTETLGGQYPLSITGRRVGAAPIQTVLLPIVFLPGVAGTQLSLRTSGRGYRVPDKYEEVWVFDPNQKREHLALNEDGRTPKIAGSNRSIVAGPTLSSWPTNFYGGLRDFLHKGGYVASAGAAKQPRQYFEFPYDWRLSNDSHFAALDKRIDEALKENPKAGKVVLLAHSMGGLIARAYLLSSSQRAMRVDKLITIGTPYWGAPKPYYGAISGYTFGNPSVRQPLMKVLQQNWPAGYQLMPGYEFVYDLNNKRYLTLNESNRIKYRWTNLSSGLLRDTGFASYTESPGNVMGFNRHLVDIADLFRRSFGTPDSPVPLPLGIPHYVIIGTGIRTLSFFEMKTAAPPERFLELDGRKVMMGTYFSDGDGTVPLEGSKISTATATYYVPYVEKWGPDSSSAHGDLPNNKTVQEIVGQILAGNPPPANSYSYKTAGLCANNQGRYSTTHLDCEKLIDLEPGVSFTLRSDAYLNIKDADTGRELGFNSDGGIVEDLPSGSFISMEGAEYAAIADVNRPLDITVNGIRDGKFTLEVNVVRPDGQMKKFAYQEVAVRNGSLAKVGFTPGQATALPDLAVTTNGATQMVKAIELEPDRPLIPRRTEPQKDPSLATDGTFLGSLPLAGAKVRSFRFFTSNGDEPPPVGTRTYRSRFNAAELRVIYYEIVLEYSTDGPRTFNMTATWNREGEGSPFARHDLAMSKPPDFNVGTRTYGHAYRAANQWKPGTYSVRIQVGADKIAEGTFVVE